MTYNIAELSYLSACKLAQKNPLKEWQVREFLLAISPEAPDVPVPLYDALTKVFLDKLKKRHGDDMLTDLMVGDPKRETLLIAEQTRQNLLELQRQSKQSLLGRSLFAESDALDRSITYTELAFAKMKSDMNDEEKARLAIATGEATYAVM